ncbi:hypothetical protein DGo_CA0699 [Deinococcus gobiensis I-0]|uniref:Uncharacterized protein n=1 Tax=Deinococcus gobiensis (strain DSM 21396 / JCM 16679 / CGMCC 1.7299 / I-0) TaxID=745776 RepID=H8GXG6_DEIGI|nr:hypothetical protein DGo_CA0699 [Deinococcus gobiensis I-0]
MKDGRGSGTPQGRPGGAGPRCRPPEDRLRCAPRTVPTTRCVDPRTVTLPPKTVNKIRGF